jgi:hypothetical protein
MNTSTKSHLLPPFLSYKLENFPRLQKVFNKSNFKASAVEIETEIFGEEVDSFENLCNLLCMHSFVPVENKLGERDGEATSANKLDLQKD